MAIWTTGSGEGGKKRENQQINTGFGKASLGQNTYKIMNFKFTKTAFSYRTAAVRDLKQQSPNTTASKQTTEKIPEQKTFDFKIIFH